jgi:hypothetical protein
MTAEGELAKYLREAKRPIYRERPSGCSLCVDPITRNEEYFLCGVCWRAICVDCEANKEKIFCSDGICLINPQKV